MGLRWAHASVGALLIFDPSPTEAQTPLPEVVVTTPSPVRARPRPAPVRRAARPAPTPQPTAAPSAVEARPVVADTFVSTSVVPTLEILRTPGATLGDTLFTLPGVTGNTFAPGASRPVIRGLDNARVRVQENGVGAMDVSTISEDHAVPVDPIATDRIEIVRGPASLRYGPSAIGGVVAAINNRIPDPMTPEGLRFTSKGAFSTADNAREGAIAADARNGNVAVHADYFRRVGGDYRIPGGATQPNTAVNAWGASAGASTIGADGYFGLSVSHYASLYGIPGIESAANQTRIDLNQTKIIGQGEWRVQGTIVDTIRLWLGGSFYKHDERALEGGVDTAMATFRNNEFEGRTEFQLVPVPTAFGVLNTAIGIQGGIRGLGTSGEAGSLLAPSETTRAAAYLFNELTVTPSLRLQAAGRIGVHAVSGTAAAFPAGFLPDGSPVPEDPRRRTFFPGSVSFGALYDLPMGVVAFGNVTYSQRGPEAQELFSKGPHEASGTFEIGNPLLGKEAATAFEVGLRRARGDVRFEATVFHMRYHGFITKRLTGNTCGEEFDTCIAGPGEELKQVVFDQKDATFTGAELAAQVDLTRIAGGTFGIDGQFDYVRARFTDGTSVPRIPPMRAGGGVYWRNDNWYARVGLLHAFAQNAIAGEETATPGYNLLKAELSYTHRFKPTDLMREVTLGIVGTNLLDENVRNHVSFKKDEVLQPGRGVRFFTTMRF